MVEARMQVLVVDDDPGIRQLLTDALRNDLEVQTAADGDEAHALLAARAFDCVLADQMMPGLTGTQLLTRASELQPHAVRILMTAGDRLENLEEVVNVARVHRFLVKPLRLLELKHVIVDAIRAARFEEENRRLLAVVREQNVLLARALASVQEHEHNLERLVEQRTGELKKAMSDLEQLALRDGLTGLYNHRFFHEALATELSRASRYGMHLGLLFVDVDHFKSYNDRLGHPAGDDLLRTLARVLVDAGALPGLRHRGRTSDVAARYGGEEFVLLLPQTDRAGAAIRAERLRQDIAAYPFPHGEGQPLGRITVSVGVAAFPEDATTPAGLVEAADQMLLLAKRAGRDCVKVCNVDAHGPREAA